MCRLVCGMVLSHHIKIFFFYILQEIVAPDFMLHFYFLFIIMFPQNVLCIDDNLSCQIQLYQKYAHIQHRASVQEYDQFLLIQ